MDAKNQLIAGESIVIEPTDPSLIEAIRAGDRAAEFALDQRWRRKLEQFAWTVVRDRALAEDVAQIVLWRVHLAKDQFDPSRAFEPWLFTIARNVAIGLMRRRKAEVSFEDQVVIEKEAGVESPVMVGDAKVALHSCVNGLNEKSKNVIALYKMNFGLTEIAKMLDRPKTTVQSWLQAALEQLRLCMTNKGFGD